MNAPEPITRTQLLQKGQIVEGTVTSVEINEDPFHCKLKITPTDPDLQIAEGNYNQNNLSKLQQNLIRLKFKLKDIPDMLLAVESLKGRKCVCVIDKPPWFSRIEKLTMESIPTPTEPEPEVSRRKPDKSIETRADRAEDLLKLVGNCFDYTNESKARNCMKQLETAFEKLKRQFDRKYPKI